LSSDPFIVDVWHSRNRPVGVRVKATGIMMGKVLFSMMSFFAVYGLANVL
jgi:hypothetical protein